MSGWTNDDLEAIGDAEELRIASRRSDGSLRPYIIIWVVRHGDELYVRSAYGPDNPWFVRARRSGSGRIAAGGVERDVRIIDPGTDAELHEALDAAYRAKYGSHPPRVVATVVGPQVVTTTLRLDPVP
ncbi:DUF2255 family protein [Agromyces sp. Marseille-P2726]|uniref:DUF2255 family protein n=1 Tax=Agromyces sp. Marseille-P2726 TaxID=2709132 RepID=UPI00156EC993|nr:DUF2255 family protein [Agromyces sp. Marseille-P2726]